MQLRSLKVFKVFIIAIAIAILAIVFVFLLYYSTSVTKNIDNYTYALPFKKGTRHKVIQGYGGVFTHRFIAALDFEMPVGTPVYAARGGIIYSYKDDSNEGGLLPKYKNKANFIIIKHNDGTFGCYWHLKKDGVLVKNGQVSEGQLIGFSGATGQVFSPHLHFSVKRLLNYDTDAFLKTKFKTSKGVMILSRGESYECPLN